MGFVWYEELCRCYRVLTSKDKIESPNLNTIDVNLTKSRSSLATVSMLAIDPPNFLFKKVATSRSVSYNMIRQLPVLGIRKISSQSDLTNQIWTTVYDLWLYRACTSYMVCQHFDFNSANWFTNNLHMSSSWYLQTIGKELTVCFSRHSWDRKMWHTLNNTPCFTLYANYLQVPAMQVSIALISVAHVPTPFPTMARPRQVHNTSVWLQKTREKLTFFARM